MIANDFDGFVEKVSGALRVALNTPFGQELTHELLQMKLANNPDLTPEQWTEEKSRFMTFLFCKFVQDCPGMMQELAGHVWNELQEESHGA